MRLSTRNQFPGTVVSITKGEAMAVVKVAVDGTDLVVTAAVTRDAVEDLGEGFRGGWVMNPANIVHMVREPDAW